MYDYHGLKNSTRAVYEAIIRLTAEARPISLTVLCDVTGYTRPTVNAAIKNLRRDGLISNVGYRIMEENQEEIMVGLFRSLANIIAMSNTERWERLIMAFTAERIYNDAQKLKALARRRGGDFQERVEVFLEVTGADRLTTVWPLDEAAVVREKLDVLIEEGKAA